MLVRQTLRKPLFDKKLFLKVYVLTGITFNKVKIASILKRYILVMWEMLLNIRCSCFLDL